MDGMKRRPQQTRQLNYRSPGLRVTPRRPVAQTRVAKSHTVVATKPVPVAHAHVELPKTPSPPVPPKVHPAPPKLPVPEAKISANGSTDKPKKTRRKKRTLPKRHILPVYALAGLVLLVGSWLTYQAYMANRAVDTQVARLTDQGNASDSASTNLPTDEKPKDANFVSNYKVAPLVPQTITIKKINVFARTLQVGTDKEGRMDVPKTAYDAAWYTGSSRPGELGAMVINGHVQGVGGPAIFTKLGTLVAGDVIGVKRGDGQQFSYTVVATEHVAADKVNMAKVLVSQNTAKPGLNLITCGGDYNNATGQFAERTIIYAVQA